MLAGDDEGAAGDAGLAAVATSAPGAELAAAEPFELPSASEVSPAPVVVARIETEAPAPLAVSNTPAAPRIVLPQPVASVAVAAPKPAKARPVAAKPQLAKPSAAFAAAFVRKPGPYSVQLGSYASVAAANDAWTRFQKRHPELKGSDRAVTKAVVNGKTYYRVAAAGFARDSAASFCAGVRRAGGGCLAYATARTLPGAAPTSTRVAAR